MKCEYRDCDSDAEVYIESADTYYCKEHLKKVAEMMKRSVVKEGGQKTEANETKLVTLL